MLYSETHSLSPEGDENWVVDGHTEADVGKTYDVLAQSGYFEASFEWEVSDGSGVISIEVTDFGIEYKTASFEG